MVDRTILGNGKSRMLRGPADMPTDFATWRSQLIAGTAYVDVLANNETTGSNAGVSSVGTPLNKENLLKDATAAALGLSGNPTIDDALAQIASGIEAPFPISKGGTGGTTNKDALNNLMYFGANPIASTSDDTVTYWNNKGTGYCNITQILLNDQPSQYGFLLNFSFSQSVVQLWKGVGGGAVFVRDGDTNGWRAPFQMLYDGRNGIVYSATQPSAKEGKIWLKPV